MNSLTSQFHIGSLSDEANVEKRCFANTTTSCWSIVPLFLKPDAVEGDSTEVSGYLAADFARYLSAAIDNLSDPTYEPFITSSRTGAERARVHARNEMNAVWWYSTKIKDVAGCQLKLQRLHNNWQQLFTIHITEIVLDSCLALGFHVVATADRVMSENDYMAFYGDKDEPEMHEKMKHFMVGHRIKLLLVCGHQENSALQLMKTFLRYVMRYPIERRHIRNWLHVTNPDASNYPELLKMYSNFTT